MASPLISKTSFHARSISLPSRPHPIAEQFEEHLCRLKSSEYASSSTSTPASYQLSVINDMYSCIDELIQLPINQQKITEERSLDNMLDGSLRLLDICSVTRDALQQTKEQIQNIQSGLRRRSSGELSISNEIAQYLSARKTIKKAVKNCLKDIKKAEKNDEICTIMGMLKDVEAMTSDVFKSLLIQIAGSKKSSWSFISKSAASTSEFEELDASLSSLVVKKKKTQLHSLTTQMVTMESNIQDLDEALESVYRHLVKSRASLLNIISQ